MRRTAPLLLCLSGVARATEPTQPAPESVICEGSPSDRLSRLEERLRGPDAADRAQARDLLTARAVLMSLDQVDAEDTATCEAYLRAVLSGDAARRDGALVAARAGGALDAEGQPVLLAQRQVASETLAPPPDPSTPRGQALMRYRALVAGIGGCAIGAAVGSVTDPIAPSLATATWAVYVGPDRLAHPQRFAAWSRRHRDEGSLPDPGEEIRGGPVFLSSYAWQPRDLEEAKAETEAWDRFLRESLGLTEDDVLEIELEVEARHASLVAPTGTVSFNDASPTISGLPACP